MSLSFLKNIRVCQRSSILQFLHLIYPPNPIHRERAKGGLILVFVGLASNCPKNDVVNHK